MNKTFTLTGRALEHNEHGAINSTSVNFTGTLEEVAKQIAIYFKAGAGLANLYLTDGNRTLHYSMLKHHYFDDIDDRNNEESIEIAHKLFRLIAEEK